MQLTEIFNQLTYGELSQLSIGGGDTGEISEKNYAQILAHINLGLTALYKRFPLKESRLTIELQAGRFTYPLHSSYAQSNARSRELVKYIADAASPFKDDIHKVETLYTDEGYEVGLNDGASPYSVMTPSAAVLRVPASIVAKAPDLPPELLTSSLEVVYRANHPLITLDALDFGIDTVSVELPYSHLEPLLLFIASRVNNPLGMVNEFNVGNNYAAKYEQACQLLEVSNLRVDQNSQPDRLHRSGWV